MPTNLEKAKKHRLRVVEYYANGWEFIIRLLMGLGIYVVLRIILMAYLTRVQALAFTFAATLAELMVLIVSAILMILFIWLKGTRFHLLTALWLPVILCLVFADLIHLFQLLLLGENTHALLGYLPFILPLLLMLIYWAFDPDSLILRIAASLLFLGMSIFWVSDIPKSLDEAKNVQSIVRTYQEFSQNLQEDHLVPWEDVPQSLEMGQVKSIWHLKEVNPVDYTIAEDIPPLEAMAYVKASDIIISGIKSDLPESTQELSFSNLDHVSLHYFYKYSTTRKIITKDFQFTGDAFFILQLWNEDKFIADNVIVRKK